MEFPAVFWNHDGVVAGVGQVVMLKRSFDLQTRVYLRSVQEDSWMRKMVGESKSDKELVDSELNNLAKLMKLVEN